MKQCIYYIANNIYLIVHWKELKIEYCIVKLNVYYSVLVNKIKIDYFSISEVDVISNVLKRKFYLIFYFIYIC